MLCAARWGTAIYEDFAWGYCSGTPPAKGSVSGKSRSETITTRIEVAIKSCLVFFRFHACNAPCKWTDRFNSNETLLLLSANLMKERELSFKGHLTPLPLLCRPKILLSFKETVQQGQCGKHKIICYAVC